MKIKRSYWQLSLLIFLIVLSCGKKEWLALDETPYSFVYGSNLPAPNLPSDNPLTVSKVELGKRLFYDNLLSANNSQSCATCHVQEDGFSDKRKFSIGVEGLPGKRQAMPIINLAWNNNQFFWDGRANLLRHQSLMPIQDPLEMNEHLSNVLVKLKAHPSYPKLFSKAFGTKEITEEKISFALEAFMLTIISDNSRYDQYLNGEITLTQSEMRGRDLFFNEFNPSFPATSGADCAHCHSGNNFTNDEYMNNGLDATANFKDLGRFNVTQNPQDRAAFRTPTLRNIGYTAPYMHDGRFATLEEVIDHYNEHIQMSSSLTPHLFQVEANPTGLMLDAQEKADLLAFLLTLNDESFKTNPKYKKP